MDKTPTHLCVGVSSRNANPSFKEAVKTFYGHSEISIGDKIYTYGRYDSASTHGPGGTYGDGVLIVADRDKLLAVSRKEREIYGFTLNLSNEEATRIEKSYTDLIKSQGYVWEDDVEWKTKYKFNNDSQYQGYEFVGGDNCTTVIIDTLNDSIDDRMPPVMKISISPAMLLRSLEAIYYKDKVNPFYTNGLVTEYSHYSMK